ncbi:MAG: protein-glutamate O-methyltransferase CheR [Candidatus Eremiobacteraeota bacterium]|nr:protein-glutamate O-methyltransferase CheR [Candidatus Eremiobacteraeota bacterium]
MVESLTPLPPSVSETTSRDGALTDLELNLLLEAIVRFSGVDFRDYSQSTLKRRVSERMRGEGVATISGLQERVLHDPQAFARFLFAMSGSTGELFRNPRFFRTFRQIVVPLLRTYSFTRIWVPNCGRGEDAYSLAVILAEEGLLQRSMIYATDASELAITLAKAGRFDIGSPDEIRALHRGTDASAGLAEHAEITDRAVQFGEEMKKNIIFAQHSLVTDGSLNEFQVIAARGVLPQFNKALQFRVHNLFLNSLVRLGFLCLGAHETLRQTPHERVFRELTTEEPIYRRMR